MNNSVKLSLNKKLTGQVTMPGDKSISHRALIFSAISTSTVNLKNVNNGLDVGRTKRALENLGVCINDSTIYGVGLRGLKPADAPLYMGNSGTSMRLFIGLLAGQMFSSTLTGDSSLLKRPMQRVITPLSLMGANIKSVCGCAPINIESSSLRPIEYKLPVASAQVKSALQIASLYAGSSNKLSTRSIVRNHTDMMLKFYQNNMLVKSARHELTIPGDISSAAFLIVAALINPGSDIVIKGVSLNVTRIGFLKLLIMMGANIEYQVDGLSGLEPYGTIRARYSQLKGIDIQEHWVAPVIDELPILFIAAAAADGITTVRGAGELRVKESDRLSAMAEGLYKIGVGVSEFPDGIIIKGAKYFDDANICSYGDHRIAMSFLVAGLRHDSSIEVKDCKNIETSYPSFYNDIAYLGANIDIKESINV